VSFRDSKLTHVLQASLEKGGRTMLIVNLAPGHSDVSESLSTLVFAKEVASIAQGGK
jgi:hypothetical protein